MAPAQNPQPLTVLFDLDGTLADTAPDLARALNHLLEEQGHAHLPYETIRVQVSRGSAALVALGFGTDIEADAAERLRLRLLDLYRSALCIDTQLYPGVDELLAKLERSGHPWGIVTNKPGWLTEPLLEQMHLGSRPACVISGDTCDQRKPHPKPLLLAAERIGCTADKCLFLGDDLRDIQAGNAAGMTSLVAGWGYIDPSYDPSTWGAAGMLRAPADLLSWL